MPVSSLEFLVGTIVLAVFLPLLPTVRSRQVALAGCNLLFVYGLIPQLAAWGILLVFVASGYLVGSNLARRPRRVLLWLYVAACLAGFAAIKRYAFLAWILPPGWLDHPLSIVGLSYMLFRQIHFLIDCKEGQVERPSWWDYLNYQINLFCLLAGPIQRFQEFRESWNELEPSARDLPEVLKAYARILVGMIKMSGLAVLFLFAYEEMATRLVSAYASGERMKLSASLVQFAGTLYLYPLYMYANFSGYCDIVIGAAGLIGLRLPENFDRPYLSRNILDFWSRWHQTLGYWIRDYLFTPMYKSVAERRPDLAPRSAFACYFVAFVLAGLWHGTTSNFLVFGIIHGVGASAAKLWEMYLVRRRGRGYLKQYGRSRLIRITATVATLNYVSFSMLFFPAELRYCAVPIKALALAVWQSITG